MRVIKFRGKRRGGDECIIGDLNIINGNTFIFDRTPSAYLHSPDWFEVIPETVGQFTGLHDKNVVEIYEWDIIKSGDRTGVIEYGHGKFGINWDYGTDKHTMLGAWGQVDNLRTMCDGYNREIEVIGNIHEHSHLIS